MEFDKCAGLAYWFFSVLVLWNLLRSMRTLEYYFENFYSIVSAFASTSCKPDNFRISVMNKILYYIPKKVKSIQFY